MMKNIISSPYRKMKVLLILPVIAIVLYSFAKPEYRIANQNNNSGDKDLFNSEQKQEVKGKILQEEGNPLPGATIILMGTTEGSVSDEKGFFSLDKVPADGSLVVSYVGYRSKVIKPVFNSEMTIRMIRDTLRYTNVDISTPPPPPPIPGSSVNSSKNNLPAPPPPPPPPPPPANLKDVANVETPEEAEFVVVEELPEFPGGGKQAMVSWIIENLKYPGEALKNKITGKVNVDFMVSSTGKIKNVKVNKPVDPLLDAEAIRIISSMPDWKPGSQAGKPVDVQVMVPVEFKLK
jgi:TonB family protein